jgi:ureidoacrylate peracid hydrolase
MEINLNAEKTGIRIEADPQPVNIEPSRTAVLVVDMQNAFVRKSGYFDTIGFDLSATEAIIEPCKAIITAAREKGMKIIYLQMGFSSDLSDSGGPKSPIWQKSRALRLVREHPEWKEKFYIYGTWGSEIIEELRPQQGDIVVRKQKYDGFIGTNLEIILKTLDVRYLLFVGTATNICVETTLRHAFSLGYFPILVSGAVSPLGPAILQEATVLNVRATFGWVTTVEKFLNAARGE